MKQVKITISSNDRIVMIPMEYDESTDNLNFAEMQIDPVPNANDDISKDIVMQLTFAIMSNFKNENNG